MQVIDRIVSTVGRRIDDASPMVDARLPDGSRVNAIIPPLAIDGPHLSIRKFNDDALGADDLVRMGALTESMVRLLEGIVRGRLNVLISGGTGAGKTTLLNILSAFIPEHERIVTAICLRDDGTARMAMKEHILSASLAAMDAHNPAGHDRSPDERGTRRREEEA